MNIQTTYHKLIFRNHGIQQISASPELNYNGTLEFIDQQTRPDASIMMSRSFYLRQH